jgi:hypothetical protein
MILQGPMQVACSAPIGTDENDWNRMLIKKIFGLFNEEGGPFEVPEED